MVERVSCILGALSFNINCKCGLELHCEVVLEYGNLFEPAFYQGFVELGEGGILVFDVILQFIDASNLCISGSSIDGVLLTLFTELENFIGNLIVGFLVIGLFEQFLLKLLQAFVNAISGCLLRFPDDLGDVLLQLCLVRRLISKELVYRLNYYIF